MKWKMVNDKWKIQSGYTLIEILVALTIIGILFGFGYVNFRDFSRRQALAGIVKQVQGDLRLAQQMALSGQKPTDGGCGSSTTLDGYNFKILSGGGEYEIRASCGGASADNVTKDVFLPADITITASLNPILFKVLGQGTNASINGSDATLTLTQTLTGRTAKITITPGGEIK